MSEIWYKSIPIDMKKGDVGTRMLCRECSNWIKLTEFEEHGSCIMKKENKITIGYQLCNETGPTCH